MKNIYLMLTLIYSHACWSVIYDDYEINSAFNKADFPASSQQYMTAYFTAKDPKQAVDRLLKAPMAPLQREYILFNLLTEISQQPPQDFHQYLVDLMKSYPSQAKKMHAEGPLEVPIFNLSSKAHGIENIWLSSRTEQQFNQLFNQSWEKAVEVVKTVLEKPNRPQWLGIKNSFAGLDKKRQESLATYLLHEVTINSGSDRFISHVGLSTGNMALIEKVMQSKQQSVRQFILRNISIHLPNVQAKSLLLHAAENSPDKPLSTSLLKQFNQDTEIQKFLFNQLGNHTTAPNAAFALSQSTDPSLPQKLKAHYLNSELSITKNHVLLALKLNKSVDAKLVLDDLKGYIEPQSKGEKWLNSFEGMQQ